MKVLVIHNRYLHRGGEDAVFDAETALLRQAAEVATHVIENATGLSGVAVLQAAWRLPWSRPGYEAVSRRIRRERPDIIHVHNWFPLVTPSVYDAARDAGVPVLQSLHNYRIWCAAGTFFRDGRICEECLLYGPRRSVRYGCYRKSRLASWAVARMQSRHAAGGTWREKVDGYIVMTAFQRDKTTALGLPPDRIHVKPHFVAPPPRIRVEPGGRALYVGRLSLEKGARVAAAAFRRLSRFGLDILGSGPDEEAVRKEAAGADVRLELVATGPDIQSRMAGSSFVVFPSVCWETFGRVLVEAMACGVPVLASRLGGVPEIVRDGETGLLFEPGNADELAEKALQLFENRELNRQLGKNARAEYERLYTPEKNLESLLAIYREAIQRRPPPGPASATFPCT